MNRFGKMPGFLQAMPEVDLHIDGETITHIADDKFFIPADVSHGAIVHAGYQAMIVFNAPDRYLPRA